MTAKKEEKENKRSGQTVTIFIVAGLALLVAGGLIALVAFMRIGVVSVCVQCDYDGDYCRCVERKEVKIIPGSENDYNCKGGGKRVYDEVGGFVGIEFKGCTNE